MWTDQYKKERKAEEREGKQDVGFYVWTMDLNQK